jgi:DNA-binding MarR family transcriptional regulator
MSHSEKISLATAIKQKQPFKLPQQELYLSILKTASDMSHLTDLFLRQFDITQIQYNVLRILRGAGPEGLCRNEISERMITAAPDMSRLLDRMERDGLITRSRDREDRRQVSSSITRKGEMLLERMEAPITDFHKKLLQPLSAAKTNALLDSLAEIRGLLG